MSNRAVLSVLVLLAAPARGQDAPGSSVTTAETTESEGLLVVPDYSGSWTTRSVLTGDWAGVRQEWADTGLQVDVGSYHVYQDIVNGGRRETSELVSNLDYRVTLDLMRMGAVPGALVTARAQSRFGDTVNDFAGPSCYP